MTIVEGTYRVRPGSGVRGSSISALASVGLGAVLIGGLLVKGGTVDAPVSPATDAAHLALAAPEPLKVEPAAVDSATQPKASTPAPQPQLAPQTQPEPQPQPAHQPETPPIPTRAVPRFDGVPAPGLRVWLDARGSTGEGNRYKWIQTRGPAVNLDLPEADHVSFIVPTGAAWSWPSPSWRTARAGWTTGHSSSH